MNTLNLKPDNNTNKEVQTEVISQNSQYILCVGFLFVSCTLMLLINSDFKRIFGIILFLPNYLCAEFVAEKLLHKASCLISIKRILIGTLVGILLITAFVYLLQT